MVPAARPLRTANRQRRAGESTCDECMEQDIARQQAEQEKGETEPGSRLRVDRKKASLQAQIPAEQKIRIHRSVR